MGQQASKLTARKHPRQNRTPGVSKLTAALRTVRQQASKKTTALKTLSEVEKMTPYGYRIVGGEALINSEEALNLRTFFKLYLQGYSVAEANHDAHINKSLTASRLMLSNRTYLGDGFYPRIMPDAVFSAAQAERAKRNRRPEGLNTCTLFPVPVSSLFRLSALSAPATSLEETAVELFSALYGQLEPAQQDYAADCFQTTMPAQDARRIQQMFTNTQPAQNER